MSLRKGHNPSSTVTATNKEKLKDQNMNDEIVDKIKMKPGELPVKIFEARESIITEILKNKHLTAVYNLFAALLIGTYINAILINYLYNGELGIGFRLIAKAFRNFDKLVLLWSCVFCSALGIFYGFQYWAKIRLQLIPKSLALFMWDKFCIICLIVYIMGLLYFSATVATKHNFGFATTMTALTETTRILMKVYAFIRTNATRFTTHKFIKDWPKFSKYLYFLFAPTLIYKDEYPRSTESIRWNVVATHFLEIAGSIFFCSLIYEKSYILSLKDYGLTPYNWKDILLIIFQNAFYAMLCSLLIFYFLLHSWLNAFAEMLQFSDRLFYKDWWTSSSYARYYRTWNCVVHDWLYTYVYKDFYEIVVPKNKIIAKLMVFFLSSLFHEYITSVSIGFFLPTFTIQFFVIGTIMYFVKFKNDFVGNVFLWYSLGLGCSMMYTFNAMEYYSRINCAKENITFENFFTPKLIICNTHLQ